MPATCELALRPCHPPGCFNCDDPRVTENLSDSLQLGAHGFYSAAQFESAEKATVALRSTGHSGVGAIFLTTHHAPDWACHRTGTAKDELDRLVLYFARLCAHKSHGKAYRWPRVPRCHRCDSSRPRAHGYVGRCFDGIEERLWMRRWRCPECSAVHTARPAAHG